MVCNLEYFLLILILVTVPKYTLSFHWIKVLHFSLILFLFLNGFYLFLLLWTVLIIIANLVTHLWINWHVKYLSLLLFGSTLIDFTYFVRSFKILWCQLLFLFFNKKLLGQNFGISFLFKWQLLSQKLHIIYLDGGVYDILECFIDLFLINIHMNNIFE